MDVELDHQESISWIKDCMVNSHGTAAAAAEERQDEQAGNWMAFASESRLSPAQLICADPFTCREGVLGGGKGRRCGEELTRGDNVPIRMMRPTASEKKNGCR